MNRRILIHALAMVLCIAAVGCAPGFVSRGPASSLIGSQSSDPGQYLDLRDGMTQVPKGYGTVTVHVTGLPGSTGYSDQTLGNGTKTVVIRVRTASDFSDVKDVTGNAAIYQAVVKGTTATIAFPALPSTSTNPADLNTVNGSPYIFQLRCYSASKSFPTAVFSTTGATLSSWVSPSDVTENLSDPTVLASGEARQNVVAGLPTTVSIPVYAQPTANLDTQATPMVDDVILSPSLTPDASKTIRIRLTGVTFNDLGNPSKAPAFATGGFTVGGTPQVGDTLSVSWTDIDGNSDGASYTVAPGDTSATIAANLATALNSSTPAGTNYSATTSSTALTITSRTRDGIWDASPAGTMSVRITGPLDSIGVFPAAVTGGSSTTQAQATLTFSLANGFAAPEAGDAVMFNFQDQESPTPHSVADIYTLTSSDTSLAALALDMANYLNSKADFNAVYTASNSGDSVIITANSVGSQYNSSLSIPNAIVPPSASDTATGLTNIGGGEPLTVIRAALNYTSPDAIPASWSVSLAGPSSGGVPGTGPGDSTHLGLHGLATSSVLIGGATWQGSTLLYNGSGLSSADTVQYIDIPVQSSTTDGVWDFEIYDPGTYTSFEAFDLETGGNASTSVSLN